jgi:hypothetical protein
VGRRLKRAIGKDAVITYDDVTLPPAGWADLLPPKNMVPRRDLVEGLLRSPPEQAVAAPCREDALPA